MAQNKRVTIAGTGVDLYLESAFADKTKKSGKPFVNVVARKRRDIDPTAPYAGGYVANREVQGKNGKTSVRHNQIITLASYNKILALNGKEPMSQESLAKAADEAEAAINAHQKVKPLATGRDGLAFKSNVFSDDRHSGPHGSWTHVFSQRTINEASKPFDYAKESALNKEAREAKAEKGLSQPEKVSKAATVGGKTEEPEL